MDLNDRIAEALRSVDGLVKKDDSINYRRAAELLSEVRPISRQSVKSWCTDAKEIKRNNIEMVAQKTGYRMLWLLNGTLPKLASEEAITPERFKAETIRHADLYQRLPSNRREIIDALMLDWFADVTDVKPHRRKPARSGESANEPR